MGLGRIQAFFRKYPLGRGMLTYSLLWPTSNLCQQAIQGREEFDFAQAARFSIFGTFVIAPSLYGWVKVAGFVLPGSTLKMAVTKVPLKFHLEIIFSFHLTHLVTQPLNKLLFCN